MNKSEFLDNLRNALSGLPDREKTIDYYSEMIDDAIEAGEEERLVIARMGSVSDIAEKAINETPISSFVKADVKKRGISMGAIALIIIGSPVWLPILVAAFSVLFSLYLTVWSLALTLFIVFAAFALYGAAALIASPVLLFSGAFLKAGIMFGSSLATLGAAVFMFYISIWVVKGLANFTVFCGRKIKGMFIRKESKIK